MLHYVNITSQLSFYVLCFLRQEQHMLAELARPQTWAGTHRQNHYESLASPSHPVYIYQAPPPAPPPALAPTPQPPRIIQHTVRE